MITLYSSLRSGNGHKVMFALEEVGASYEVRWIDPRKGEQRSPEFVAKNPNAKVPLLDHDGFLLFESNAIVRYVARIFGGPSGGNASGARLMPEAAREQALVDQWMDWQATMLYPPAARVWMHAITTPPEKRDAELLKMEGEAIRRWLKVLEGQLTGREYVTGAFSAADCAFAPLFRAFGEAGFELTGFPQVQAYGARLGARPAWKRVVERLERRA